MSAHKDISYMPVNSSDTKESFDDDFHPPSTARRTLMKVLLAITAIVLIFATVFGAVSAALVRQNDTSRSNTPVKPLYDSCGQTAQEARSRGCTFDVISFSWLTPECYDAKLTEEFINWSDQWTWYLEDDETQTMSLEEAKRGEKNAVVDWHYHVVHCTFMWRQMHRGIERGWIGYHLRSYNHTKHCQHTFLQDPEQYRDVRTPARVIFPKCLQIGVEDGMYPGPPPISEL